jgi:hypothetical protein
VWLSPKKSATIPYLRQLTPVCQQHWFYAFIKVRLMITESIANFSETLRTGVEQLFQLPIDGDSERSRLWNVLVQAVVRLWRSTQMQRQSVRVSARATVGIRYFGLNVVGT